MVKTQIDLSDIAPYFDVKKITQVENGATDSVYLLDDNYILKIFENASVADLQNELAILDICKNLPVAKAKSDIFFIANKPCLVYEKANGNNIAKPTKEQLNEIGIFLKKFHNITKNIQTKNMLYTKNEAKKLAVQNIDMLSMLEKIDIDDTPNCVIHGDLFMDNVSFNGNKLECVYDFIECGNGNSLVDLGCVLIWCIDENGLNLELANSLFSAYGYSDSLAKIIEYAKFVLIYYSAIREINGRDSAELMNKLRSLM